MLNNMVVFVSYDAVVISRGLHKTGMFSLLSFGTSNPLESVENISD